MRDIHSPQPVPLLARKRTAIPSPWSRASIVVSSAGYGAAGAELLAVVFGVPWLLICVVACLWAVTGPLIGTFGPRLTGSGKHAR